MSVLIKGMEMPESCDDCFLPLRYCPYAMKPDGSCPLIELPPHGRLIDADDFFRSFPELIPYEFAAPTILEAEVEE